jgi:hypothetical protein
LIMEHEDRPLTLLVQSRAPFSELLPNLTVSEVALLAG